MVINMRDEYDFSKGERGKFYRQDAKLNIPIYRGIDRSTVVNDLIKGNIKIAQAIE